MLITGENMPVKLNPVKKKGGHNSHAKTKMETVNLLSLKKSSRNKIVK